MIADLLTILKTNDCRAPIAMPGVCLSSPPHAIAGLLHAIIGLSDFLYGLLDDMSASPTAPDRASHIYRNHSKPHSKRRSISGMASFK
jgi:hypothetical protein